MATNIQIKRGSGSNTPSSLLQGEMAVNMDTGQLYFGSGSTKTPINSYKFTNVTASGHISSSGTVYATSYTGLPTGLISGSGQLPSGVISGSSQLPSGIFSGSSQLPSGIISGSSQLPSGLISGSSQLPSGIISGSSQLPSGIYSSSTQILGNITSSGNISSSGDILGLNSNIIETGSVGGSLRIYNPSWGNSHVRAFAIDNSVANQLDITSANYSLTYMSLNATTGTYFNGNVSSSGHNSASSFIGSGAQVTGVISSSYAVTASHALNSGGSVSAGTVSSSAQIVTLGFAQTSSATNVTFGNVSSSGHISASGTGSFNYVQAPTIHGSGSTALLHIDGNVSASGYVSASAVNAITYEGSGSGTVIDVEGQISASGYVSASSFIGSGAQILGIVSSSYAVTASHALNAGSVSAGTVSSSAQIEDLGFALTSSVNVYLNFEEATTYHYIVPYNLRFDGYATSSVFTATFSSSGATYSFGSTLNQFTTLHVTSSAAGLVSLSGSRV